MKRKAITPAEMKREYRRCLAREKDRYREWAKTRQGAFETRQILHFDAEAEEACEREQSTSWLSDRGKGAAAIRRNADCSEEKRQKRRRAALTNAYMMVRRKLPHCLKTFGLVVKNGSNRKESIWALAKTR